MDVDKVLADVGNVKAYTYNFKKDPEDPRWGFIAQEVQAGPLAHLVNGEETEDSYLGINYVDMIAVIPALVKKVLALEKKVSELLQDFVTEHYYKDWVTENCQEIVTKLLRNHY